MAKNKRPAAPQLMTSRSRSRAATHQASVAGGIARTDGRDPTEWFTPKEWVDACRDALGGTIDLDPFSCAEANRTVGARFFFSKEHDALTRPWVGHDGSAISTVFMNPPYGRKECPPAIARFLEMLKGGHFERGIVLVNNYTDNQYFASLLTSCTAFALSRGRIGFENVDGKRVSGNTRGQVLFYFDHEGTYDRFRKAMIPVANVCVPATSK